MNPDAGPGHCQLCGNTLSTTEVQFGVRLCASCAARRKETPSESYENPHVSREYYSDRSQSRGQGWLKTIGGIASSLVITGIIAGVCTLTRGEGDPYYGQVSDLTNSTGDLITPLAEGAIQDFEACERAIFSAAACDRGIEKFDEIRQIADTGYSQMLSLDPPASASHWHGDYLAFLSDISSNINRAVNAYYDLDVVAYEQAIDDLLAVIDIEDELVTKFEDLQR